jgi:dTDP-4-amino-4,6-dideoxygalactose transaminase
LPRIPLLDLDRQHRDLAADLTAAIGSVLTSGRFVDGPAVEGFEHEFALFCGARHCVGVSSGTAALTLALRAAGIGPGDEVITTAMTFIATAGAILEAGATPVLVDPDLTTGLISAAAAAAAVGPRTRAIVPVHLWGQPVDLQAFRALCDRHGLFLLEDACQAHGSWAGGQRTGSVGDAAAFSFYPGKNLGAIGDAGAIVTSDAALAARLRALRDHGRTGHTEHAIAGTNARMAAVQAAVLSVKLPHVERWNGSRRRTAALYDAALQSVPDVTPIGLRSDAVSAYHHYVLRCTDRDAVSRRLRERSVASGVHYPVPVHRHPALAGLVRTPEPLPVAERLAREVLSVPVHQDLGPGDAERVIATLVEASDREQAA